MNILIVDDDHFMAESFRHNLPRLLQNASIIKGVADVSGDCQVVAVDTVAAAFHKLKQTPFDILIVDLKIPTPTGAEFGGLDIVSESIKLDPYRPIIVVTGYGSIELVKRTLQQGEFDFIEKKVDAIDKLV